MKHELKVVEGKGSADREQAKLLDAQFAKAERGMVEIVVLGAALIATKGELTRRAIEGGDSVSLKAWLAEHLPERSYSAAHRSMQVAEAAVKAAKLSGSTDLGWLLTAGAGELSRDLESKRAKLEKILAETSQRQLLLWGAEKTATKPDAKGHRTGGAHHDHEKDTAEAFWSDLLVSLEVEGFKEASWMHLDKTTRKALAESLRDLSVKISKSL